MATNRQIVGVQMSTELITRIDMVAARRQCSRSAVIRSGTIFFLDSLDTNVTIPEPPQQETAEE